MIGRSIFIIKKNGIYDAYLGSTYHTFDILNQCKKKNKTIYSYFKSEIKCFKLFIPNISSETITRIISKGCSYGKNTNIREINKWNFFNNRDDYDIRGDSEYLIDLEKNKMYWVKSDFGCHQFQEMNIKSVEVLFSERYNYLHNNENAI